MQTYRKYEHEDGDVGNRQALIRCTIEWSGSRKAHDDGHCC